MSTLTKFLASALVTLAGTSAFAQNSNPDNKFATAAANAGMEEVTLSKLADGNSSSARVKEFAKMMISDHQAVNNELMAKAQQKGIELPSTCEKCKSKSDELSKLNGMAFDKKYMSIMVSAHKEAVEKFTKEANDGKDPELKAWAAEKLPALKHHLSVAESVHKELVSSK